MNTIHSSSLAFRPAGYTQPEPKAVDFSQKSATTLNESARQAPPNSTPTQIQAAIKSVGLGDNLGNNSANNLRSSRALATYLETRNQPLQAQLSSLVTGIDLYA